ncbi:MAG: PAS domain S-box protein [Candidatus Abyssobacteria bacterium SURF_5]|uniref:Oxygen sensor histidine kinase NreB n=1 Tax=Abyssobacteria bacterium (strain SURF_5) TaxID=2093360 RepID=A0A3A4N8Q9_ABYX5|nr:MAG: PAS domain S-box protein [Candidatus Abyssubacteria bacterium SURF_5]
MKKSARTKNQLLEEIHSLKARLAHLEQTQSECQDAAKGLREESEKAQRYIGIAEVMFLALDAEGTVTFANRKTCEVLGYEKEEILGKNWFDHFLPESIREDAKTAFQKLLVRDTRQVEYHENSVLSKNGEERVVAWHNVILTDEAGAVTGILCSGQDVTEHKRVEKLLEKRTRELVAHSKQIQCLFGISRLVEQPDSSLATILQGTVELIPAGLRYSELACARVILDDKEYRTPNFAKSKWKQARDIMAHGDRIGSLEIYYPEDELKETEKPFANEERDLVNAIAERLGSIIERARIEEALEAERRQLISMFDSLDEVVYVADPATHEILYMNSPAREQWGVGVGEKCYRVLQNLDSPCPFCTNDRIFGENIGQPYVWEFQNPVNRHWYHCIDRAIRWPDGRMVRFEMAIDITEHKLADLQIQALSSKVIQAHEMERKLVAQDIHDSVGAGLATIKYSLERQVMSMDEGAVPDQASFKQIIATLQRTIEESRRISTNLRPSILDDLGLLPTISWLCREFQAVYSTIHIDRQTDVQENEIGEPLKIVILRILQEALNNIAKHSGASLAHLSLSKTPGGIELTIRDNGIGFDPQAVKKDITLSSGLGLASMKERAELSGGAFRVESVVGSGTRIRAIWPNEEGAIS